ncbi:MAG: hypothetical protein ACSHYA_11735 [Opitutaceae bacterium]
MSVEEKDTNLQLSQDDEIAQENSTLRKIIHEAELETLEIDRPSYRLHAAEARTGNRMESQALVKRLLVWAEKEPLSALEFAVNELQPLAESKKAIMAILQQWAESQPEQAWTWAEENASYQLVNLVSAIAKLDPELGWEKAKRCVDVNPNDLLNSYYNAIQGTVYSGDYELALSLLQKADIPVTPDTQNGKYTFVEEVITDWSLFSPDKAAEWIINNPQKEDSALKSLANTALLRIWSNSDPEAALNYAKDLTIDKARRFAVGGALEQLVQQDITKASEWLNEHGNEEWFDPNIYDLSTMPEVVSSAPVVAVEWADSIVDPQLRIEALTNIAADWIVQDPDTATGYLARSGLLPQDAWQAAQDLAEIRSKDVDLVSPHDELFNSVQ